MDKLSYSEVMAILGNNDFPFTAISRDGVFIDTKGLDESWPEYEVIREMETAHPQKDIAKPLFTFPCSVEQLRDFLLDNDAVSQLSGVIYLEKDKTYTASDILALMLDANIKETALIPKNHSFYGFSKLYKESVLDDHQGQKTHYKQQIIRFLERYSIVVTSQNVDEQLKNISFKNIMANIVTWLQGERFAVFYKNTKSTQRSVAWKKVLYHLWPDINKAYPNPTARQVMDYLREYDDFGVIKNSKEIDVLKWIDESGQTKETILKTLQNEISKLKNNNPQT